MKASISAKYNLLTKMREDGALPGPWNAWLHQESAGYDVARALLRGGVLPDPVYRQALALFGERGTAELIFLIGHHCFVSVTFNRFATTPRPVILPSPTPKLSPGPATSGALPRR